MRDGLSSGKTSADDVMEMAEAKGIEMIDLRFADLPGAWQHFSVPLRSMTEDVFTEGIGFDGSSIRGFKPINESDMLMVPDPDTATVDPLLKVPTLYMICNVVDPITGKRYTRDSRYVAQKAEAYLRSTSIADTSYWGPEAEFYIFNGMRFDQTAHSGYYHIESDEGIWNRAANTSPNLGFHPRLKEGYSPVPPTDKLQDLRSEIVQNLIQAKIDVEAHHHEVGTAGQAEIKMRYKTLTTMADAVMIYKYVIKNVCQQRGYMATFMPKPLFQDNGSGMHTHQSLWKHGSNVFFDANGYALLSQTARHYIGGLLKHAPALLALCAPTTNSYRRLVPGYEAPIYLVYSQQNRSACVRIPVYSTNPKFRRIEFRPPDASCNPYLAFAAMLMAGLDGIKNKLDPPDPIDEDLYERKIGDMERVPRSLADVLKALEVRDRRAFLLEGGVFDDDLLDKWIEYKWRHEVEPVDHRPVPWEFHLYHDV
jgi:glutamine synthetase